MIILIAPENDIPNEIEILHQLFEAGLLFYHLRKPNKNYDEHVEFLNQIDSKYHNRIVVHYFHELVNHYPLKGIHFQEAAREMHLEVPSVYFMKLQMFGKTISSSFHKPETIANVIFEFDYHLLSTVFASISKTGYEGKGFDVTGIRKTIIGMGGVTAENVPKLIELGYKGIGVLGGIWHSASPLATFKKMKTYFE
jgi:thiamine-phosphate pyrophosphorylase